VLASNGCWQRPHSTATADEQPLFSQLELRVGQIVKVWEHPTADRLWCEEIDVGEDAPRQIASGLRQVYTEEEMLGQRLVVVCNLKKRKLMGFPSHGMVLCAMSPPEEEGGAPAAIEFVVPPDSASLGDRVVIAAAVTDEATGEMAPPVSAAQVKKRKVWEQIQPLLSTDEEGVARFDGDPMECSAGAVLTAPTIRNGIVS
jgi:methionine--tRNA ligase beta chain